MIDWGVGYLNLYTDMKRIAYVLKEGERDVPLGIQNAFEQGSSYSLTPPRRNGVERR